MLEHIDREYSSKILVKHQMGVEALTVQEDHRVSLEWVQTTTDGKPPANGPLQRGAAVADFVVCSTG
jgi:hypothetical protein